MNTFSTNGSSSARPGSQVLGLAAGVVAIIALIAAGMAFNAALKSEKKISDLNARITEATDAQAQTSQSIKTLAENVQRVLNEIGTQINTLNTQVAQMKTPPKPEPKKTAAGEPKGGEEKTGEAAPPSGKTYTIKEGDTLGRVASRHQIKLADLEKANPGINSARLKIGQKINLP